MDETYAVYVSEDKTSLCIPTGYMVRRRELEGLGMRLVWEDAPSPLAGWALAAREHGCIPDDYDDRMLPVACFERRRLFRSVSPEELFDVVRTGSVSGGGNGFNGFDRRPFVFFSPAPTEACLWQGQELERAASVQVLLAAGGVSAFEGPDGPARFKGLYASRLELLRLEREAAAFTSALLCTHPVGPSLHYSREHGMTGMNGEDEYGLFPRQVRLDDIREIHLMKGCDVVDVLGPSRFADLESVAIRTMQVSI